MTGYGPFPPVPDLVPFPQEDGGPCRVLPLDGTWRFLPVDPALAEGDPAQWGASLLAETPDSAMRGITLPCSLDRLTVPDATGYSLCLRRIDIPASPLPYRAVLRFEAVNAHAAVFVDGSFAARHENGFVAWTRDVTPFLPPAREDGTRSFTLALALDDVSENVSIYSHGGPIHSISLLLLPPLYLSALRADGRPEPDGTASLRVTWRTAGEKADGHLALRLLTREGAPVPGGSADLSAGSDAREGLFVFRGLDVLLWDAEHPNLYVLEARLATGGSPGETVRLRTGFRLVERRGNRVTVNGQPVKLRGVCRHEIEPLTGRATAPGTADADAQLLLDANVNYVRTSHYPPTERFLDRCDELGIYVEDELALAFIGRTLPYTQQDPALAGRYLSHFLETYARDSSHPCILIWSLCNESFGGIAFYLLERCARAADPTRLTKFSYPMALREEYGPADVWSVHYAAWDSDTGRMADNLGVGGAYRRDRPVLHDEYAHVPCYDRDEQRHDPAVHSWWGGSIARFWDRILSADGALGGAVWAGIDETDIHRGGGMRLEWGLVDVWRRKKPEYWEARKAYAPVLLRGIDPLTEEIAREKGEPEQPLRRTRDALLISVQDRFCHTALSELTFDARLFRPGDVPGRCLEDFREAFGSEKARASVPGPCVPPGGTGTLSLPLPQEQDGILYVEIRDRAGRTVNEYAADLTPPAPPAGAPAPLRAAVRVSQGFVTAGPLGPCGAEICFDRSTGLISRISANGKACVAGGPYLLAGGMRTGPWKLASFTCGWDAGRYRIAAEGSCGDGISLTWEYDLYGDRLGISCRVTRRTAPLPREKKLRVGVDCGGLTERGFTLVLPEGTDTLSWDRASAYSVYPRDSIARPRGTARLRGERWPVGKRPLSPWKDDETHPLLNGPYDPGLSGSSDFTASRSRLRRLALSSSGGGTSPLRVLPGPRGILHARAECSYAENSFVSAFSPRVEKQGLWYAADDPLGRDMRSRGAGSSLTLRFRGTGIVWIGPRDTCMGRADVTLDGKQARVDQALDRTELNGDPVGLDTRYGCPIFSADGLEDAEHVITVRACGGERPAAWTAAEGFRVLQKGLRPRVLLHLMDAQNMPRLSWGNRTEPPVGLDEGWAFGVTIPFASLDRSADTGGIP